MFVNQSQGLVNILTGNEEFIIRTDHNLKMMQNQNLQRNISKKMKRYRSAFTTEQVNYLEEQFKKFPYISNAQRKEVAAALGIPERAVKIWFQNRRMKEKRENICKECEEPAEHTPNEFAKAQLNNVMTPSVNDQRPQTHLPLLTDIDNVSNSKYVGTNHAPINLNTTQTAIQEVKAIEDMTGVKKKPSSSTFNSSRNLNLVNDRTKSAEFSINLCKKYKMEAFNKSDASLPNSVVKHEVTKLDIEDKKTLNNKMLEQTIPEDLSSRKLTASKVNTTQVPNVAVSNPGYISMLPAVSPFYTEPYYSPSGMFWKPVSVVPSVTTNGASVSVHIPNNVPNMPIVQQTVSKKCCKCDCHVEPLLSYNFQQQAPSPQYIITAVPFSNPSATKL